MGEIKMFWVRADAKEVSIMAPADFATWLGNGSGNKKRVGMAGITPTSNNTIRVAFLQDHEGNILETEYTIGIKKIGCGRLLTVKQTSRRGELDWWANHILECWLGDAGYLPIDGVYSLSGTAVGNWDTTDPTKPIWMVNTKEGSTKFFAGPHGEKAAEKEYLKQVLSTSSGLLQTVTFSKVERGMLGDNANIQWIVFV